MVPLRLHRDKNSTPLSAQIIKVNFRIDDNSFFFLFSKLTVILRLSVDGNSLCLLLRLHVAILRMVLLASKVPALLILRVNITFTIVNM